MFWLCSNIIQDKNKNKNKVISGSHPICGPICGSAACTRPVPERGGGGGGGGGPTTG